MLKTPHMSLESESNSIIYILYNIFPSFTGRYSLGIQKRGLSMVQKREPADFQQIFRKRNVSIVNVSLRAYQML